MVVCGLLFPLAAICQKIEFKGQVIDFVTRAPLAGVTVNIVSKGRSQVTDDKGMFSFQLDVDSYTLEFSVVGYRPLLRPIYVLDEKYITIELKQKLPTELPEVTILTRKKDANISDVKMSTVTVNLAQLKNAAGVRGSRYIQGTAVANRNYHHWRRSRRVQRTRRQFRPKPDLAGWSAFV